MEYSIKDNGFNLVYTFTLSKQEMAACEFSLSTLKNIAELEKDMSIANQLEILLEYFHAIEGTDRITELSQFIRYTQHVHNFKGFGGGFSSRAAPFAFQTSMPNPNLQAQSKRPLTYKCKHCGIINNAISANCVNCFHPLI